MLPDEVATGMPVAPGELVYVAAAVVAGVALGELVAAAVGAGVTENTGVLTGVSLGVSAGGSVGVGGRGMGDAGTSLAWLGCLGEGEAVEAVLVPG